MDNVQTESNTPTDSVQEGLLVRGSVVQVEGKSFVLNGDARVIGDAAHILAVGIPLAPPDTELGCFEKARETGEKSFTLIARDITADICVDFWVRVQIQMKQRVEAGLSVKEAAQSIREFYFLETIASPNFPTGNAKLDGAAQIAEDMRAWHTRGVSN